VGRGPHNDVRLGDESVSETHAKLQRRDDGWYVVDMGSTNGTYVGGTRITGERRLDGSPDVRFGGVKMRFSVAEGSASEAASKGTRPIASVERTRPSAAPPPEAVRTDVPRGGISRWVWLAALVAVAATAFFLLQGRA
jgi:pSer/pThr/pTyr-binding forkhead associated (FHA) protein